MKKEKKRNGKGKERKDRSESSVSGLTRGPSCGSRPSPAPARTSSPRAASTGRDIFCSSPAGGGVGGGTEERGVVRLGRVRVAREKGEREKKGREKFIRMSTTLIALRVRPSIPRRYVLN